MTYSPHHPPTDQSSARPGSLLLGTPPEPLRLRVGGGGLESQTVQISAAKCTIGAAPQCTLRLCQPGVSPLHCLVLRGALGTVVRCWSPRTRLNDAAFTDAPLRLGDRLRCGPVELEILAAPGPPAETARVRPSAGGVPPTICPATPTPPSDGALIRLRTAVEVTRRRSRRLIAQLRQARNRADQLDAMLESEKARSAWAAEHLQQREVIHTSERHDLATRNAQLQESLSEAKSAGRRLAEEHAAATAEADAQQQAAVGDLQAELLRTRGQLDSREQALSDQHAKIACLRADFQREEAVWRERLAAQERRLDELAQRSDQQEREIESLQTQLERSRQTRLETDPKQPAKDTAVVVPDRPAEQETQMGPPGAADQGDDQSIEAYLANLLGRARRASTLLPTANDLGQPVQAAPAGGQIGATRYDPGRRFKILTGIGKLLVATAGIVAAGLILAMLPWRAAGNLGPDVLFGVVALLVAAVWGLQGFVILQRVRRARAVRSISQGPWQTDQANR